MLLLEVLVLFLVRWSCFYWMTRLESRLRGLLVVVAESARLKHASARLVSDASAHSELVIVVDVVVGVEFSRLKPASGASARSELHFVFLFCFFI